MATPLNGRSFQPTLICFAYLYTSWYEQYFFPFANHFVSSELVKFGYSFFMISWRRLL